MHVGKPENCVYGAGGKRVEAGYERLVVEEGREDKTEHDEDGKM